MLCMCFISPSTKEEATFTLVLATLLHELEHLAIHTWKYTTHRVGVGGGGCLKEIWEIVSVRRSSFLSSPSRAKR